MLIDTVKASAFTGPMVYEMKVILYNVQRGFRQWPRSDSLVINHICIGDKL